MCNGVRMCVRVNDNDNLFSDWEKKASLTESFSHHSYDVTLLLASLGRPKNKKKHTKTRSTPHGATFTVWVDRSKLGELPIAVGFVARPFRVSEAGC